MIDADTIPMSDGELADWVRRRIVAREPAAVVRFAGGEAQVLLAKPGDAESIDTGIAKLERDTGISYSAEDMLEVRALLSLAFDEADVLGIRIHDRVLDSHKAWASRLASHYHERVRAGRPPARLASSMIGDETLDALPGLLRGRRVSVISCRDLKPVLEREWGAEDVAVYQMPSEHVVRDVDDAYEARMHGVPAWPDAHADIRSRLTVRERGEVFLVGAGLFGKDLCVRARDMGGIALDLGSALDRIAGKLTRGPRRRVLELHATGSPVDEIASRLARLYRVPIDADAVARELAAAVGPRLAAWRERRLEPEYETVELGRLEAEIDDSGIGRDRACHLAWATRPDGAREPLGLWWGGDGATAWRAMLEDLRRRGVARIAVACVEDPDSAFSDALAAVFPTAQLRALGGPPSLCAAVQSRIAMHGRFADEQAATALIYLAAASAPWAHSEEPHDRTTGPDQPSTSPATTSITRS